MNLISHSNGFITNGPKKKFDLKFILKLIGILIILAIVTGFVINATVTNKNEEKFIKEDKYITID
ncbi:MAG: hypothetical protein ACRDCW_06985, partial [Sarcina sp.]